MKHRFARLMTVGTSVALGPAAGLIARFMRR